MKKSFLEKLDPRSKLFFSLIVVILAITVPEIEYMIGLIIVTLLLVGFGKETKRWLSYLSIFKVLIPLLFLLNLFFYAHGRVFWSFEFYILTLSITQGGFMTSITILLRLFSIAAAAALFVISTDPVKFEAALTNLKFPWKLAFLFSLTLKLIPEMRTRYEKIKEAQLSRGLNMTGGPIERSKKKVPMLIPFLASIIRYGYELTEALEVRDFDKIGERTNLIELKHHPPDVLLYLLSISILFVYIYLNFL